MLSDLEVERFISDGFVALPGAFPRALADEAREILALQSARHVSR